MDAIKKANETNETSATLKERIQEKQNRHIQDVRTMYQWQAQDYYDEMIDLARSNPDIDDPSAEVSAPNLCVNNLSHAGYLHEGGSCTVELRTLPSIWQNGCAQAQSYPLIRCIDLLHELPVGFRHSNLI